jgi:branched-chain amino acid transport system ATP-binding protein
VAVSSAFCGVAGLARPLLDIAGLRKNFGAVCVSDNIALQVYEGEVHALIGPNGAGKTSLINQISGILSPDAGHIRFKGIDIGAMAMHQRVRIGLARSFQITSILPGFSVRENVALAVQARSGSSFRFFGRVAGEAALNNAARRALEAVGLEKRGDSLAAHLSHGEQRQLDLAIALALEPQLLVLDEPLAGMGRSESNQMLDLLRSLKRQFAILLVEHDMEAVFALSDRISVMVYGRILATDEPAGIRVNPEVRAAYLGDEG